jgi:hypothetical protein
LPGKLFLCGIAFATKPLTSVWKLSGGRVVGMKDAKNRTKVLGGLSNFGLLPTNRFKSGNRVWPPALQCFFSLYGDPHLVVG